MIFQSNDDYVDVDVDRFNNNHGNKKSRAIPMKTKNLPIGEEEQKEKEEQLFYANATWRMYNRIVDHRCRQCGCYLRPCCSIGGGGTQQPPPQQLPSVISTRQWWCTTDVHLLPTLLPPTRTSTTTTTALLTKPSSSSSLEEGIFEMD